MTDRRGGYECVACLTTAPTAYPVDDHGDYVLCPDCHADPCRARRQLDRQARTFGAEGADEIVDWLHRLGDLLAGMRAA